MYFYRDFVQEYVGLRTLTLSKIPEAERHLTIWEFGLVTQLFGFKGENENKMDIEMPKPTLKTNKSEE